MLVLTTTSDAIKLVTTSSALTDVHASWVDNAAGTVVADRKNTAISSATTTTIVGSVPSSTQRTVALLTIMNKDTSLAQTVTVQHYNGTTTTTMPTFTLLAGEVLLYIHRVGFTAGTFQ